MKNRLQPLLLVLLLSPNFVSLPSAQAQHRELPLERILNPLPDFDPFEKLGLQVLRAGGETPGKRRLSRSRRPA